MAFEVTFEGKMLCRLAIATRFVRANRNAAQLLPSKSNYGFVVSLASSIVRYSRSNNGSALGRATP